MYRAAVFPKVDARFRGRGLRQPPGLSALGCQGSVRDRLTPTGLFEGLPAQGSYIVSLRWRGGRLSADVTEFHAAIAAKWHIKWCPQRRRTSLAGTVSQPIGRPFYGQAKGGLRPTCTSYAGCAHQPSGIQLPATHDATARNPLLMCDKEVIEV